MRHFLGARELDPHGKPSMRRNRKSSIDKHMLKDWVNAACTPYAALSSGIVWTASSHVVVPVGGCFFIVGHKEISINIRIFIRRHIRRGGSIWFKMQGFDWLKKCQFLGQNNHQNSNWLPLIGFPRSVSPSHTTFITCYFSIMSPIQKIKMAWKAYKNKKRDEKLDKAYTLRRTKSFP
jgi:hypothetical protein